ELSSVTKARISVTAPWKLCSGSMELCTESLLHIIPKLMDKLKSRTGRLSKF
ncbi:hypothetical protein L195_g063834, partial [Trifolium pratense]